ncbi:MAG: hypothetical protein QG620_524 [Patescibacteria group bacterium]|nr:hypothetical protein [Patescibacteria group bacterium]
MEKPNLGGGEPKKAPTARIEAMKRSSEEGLERISDVSNDVENVETEKQRLEAKLTRAKNKEEKETIYAQLAELVKKRKEIVKKSKGAGGLDGKEESLVKLPKIKSSMSPKELTDQINKLFQSGGAGIEGRQKKIDLLREIYGDEFVKANITETGAKSFQEDIVNDLLEQSVSHVEKSDIAQKNLEEISRGREFISRINGLFTSEGSGIEGRQRKIDLLREIYGDDFVKANITETGASGAQEDNVNVLLEKAVKEIEDKLKGLTEKKDTGRMKKSGVLEEMKSLKKRAKELEALDVENENKPKLTDKDGNEVSLDDIPERVKGSAGDNGGVTPEAAAVAAAAGVAAAEAARKLDTDLDEASESEMVGRYGRHDSEFSDQVLDQASETEVEDRLKVDLVKNPENYMNGEHQAEASSEQEDPKLVELREAVKGARNAYARKDYETTNALSKLRRFFGRSMKTGTEDISDTHSNYEPYRESVNKYLDYRIEILKAQGLSQEDLKREMGELWTELNFREKIDLYEARTNARAEAREGQFGERALRAASNAVNWYRKLDWKYKLAFSGLLMAGGVGAVAMAGAGAAGTGVLAGIVGTGKFGQRIMGGASAGMGAVAMQESVRRKLDQRASRKGGERMLGDLEQIEDPERMFEVLKSRMQSEIDTYKSSLEREKRKSRNRKLIGFGIGATIGSGAFARVAQAGFGRTLGFFGYHSPYETTGAEFERPIDPNNPYETAGTEFDRPGGSNYYREPVAKVSNLGMENQGLGGGKDVIGRPGGGVPSSPESYSGAEADRPGGSNYYREPVAKVSNFETANQGVGGGKEIAGAGSPGAPKSPYETTGAEFDRPGGSNYYREPVAKVSNYDADNKGFTPRYEDGPDAGKLSGGGSGRGDMTQFEKDMRGAGAKVSGDDKLTQFERDMREAAARRGESGLGQTYTENSLRMPKGGQGIGLETENSLKMDKGSAGSNLGQTYTENSLKILKGGQGIGLETENSLKMAKGGQGIGSATENSLKMDMEKDYAPAIDSVETAQKGDSVWKMIDRQLEERYGHNFTDLPVEQKTYIIDSFKDEVAKNPEQFSLKNIDKIKIGQKIDFAELFSDDQRVAGKFDIAKNLSPEEMENIAKNNKTIIRWLNAHHGEALTSEKVEDILHGSKETVKSIKSPAFLSQFNADFKDLSEISSEMSDPASQANADVLREQYGASFKKVFSGMRRELFEGDSGIKSAEDLKSLNASEYLEDHKRSKVYKLYKYAAGRFGEEAVKPKAGEDMAVWSRKLIGKIFEAKGVKFEFSK